MVRRWDRDWEGHKEDIYESLVKEKGEKKAKQFMEHYSLRYEKHKRAFLDWKLAVELYKDYKRVKHNKIAWYGIVGEGGAGKTELAKNMAYFLDAEFTPVDFLTDNMNDFMKILKGFQTKKAMRAAILDEPDITIAPNSHEARVSRPVFGKARQQQLFLFFCATEMSDIPNFIYKRLNRIIFCVGRSKQKGQALFYKDKPLKKKYYLGKLKKDYMEKLSYEVFFYRKYKSSALLLNSYKGTPFTSDQEATYEKNKQNDYVDTLDYAVKKLGKNKLVERDKYKDKQITRFKFYKKMKFTQKQQAEAEGVTQATISQLRKEYGL